MNKVLIAVVIALAALVGATFVYNHSSMPHLVGAGGGSGIQFYYTTATTATSSVSTSWSSTPVLSADSSRGYVSFCNESVSVGQGIYLGMGATTTGISGIKVAANSCYEMTAEKMFYGNIYAIASPSATTLLTVQGKY
jgi:hypothetical protein